MAKHKEVEAEKEPLEVGTVGTQSLDAPISFEDAQGAGMEGTSLEDLKIPFIMILQVGSPQCNQANGKYIKGAVAGQLLNTVTQKVIEARDSEKAFLKVIPCNFRKRYVEWRFPRTTGGLVRVHTEKAILDQAVKGEYCNPPKTGKDSFKLFLPNGNVIEPTCYHDVLYFDPENDAFFPAVIGMSSSAIKHSQRWLSNMNMDRLPRANGKGYFTPPSYSSYWKISTVPETRDGNSWFTWKIEQMVEEKLVNGVKKYVPIRVSSVDTYEESKRFHKQIQNNQLALPSPSNDPSIDVEAKEVY